jgi:hypothetical protein
MTCTRTRVIIATAALLCATRLLIGQVPTAALRPPFAGIWTPSDRARSDELFAVGLASVPGRGRLTIKQTTDRLTVTITLPEDSID